MPTIKAVKKTVITGVQLEISPQEAGWLLGVIGRSDGGGKGQKLYDTLKYFCRANKIAADTED